MEKRVPNQNDVEAFVAIRQSCPSEYNLLYFLDYIRNKAIVFFLLNFQVTPCNFLRTFTLIPVDSVSVYLGTPVHTCLESEIDGASSKSVRYPTETEYTVCNLGE